MSFVPPNLFWNNMSKKADHLSFVRLSRSSLEHFQLYLDGKVMKNERKFRREWSDTMGMLLHFEGSDPIIGAING